MTDPIYSTVDTTPVPSTTPKDVSLKAQRPKGLPDKFWDPVRSDVNVGALWKSYQQLERKFSAGHGGFIPDHPDGYCLDCGERNPDAEVNAILHRAGFTNDQAQLVYDLATEYVVPELDRRHQALAMEKLAGRLEERFGGPERWAHVARQLEAWGKAHLPEDVLEVMGASYDGVMALHRMMTSDEPGVADRDAEAPSDLDEAGLRKLMENPKYWRDRDPALITKVRDGFKRLYPG